MKIAQLTTGQHINGAVRHCYDLSNELGAMGHEVILIHRPGSWIETQPLHDNVIRFATPIRRNFRNLKQVADYLKKAECRLIHTHLSGASFFGVLLARLFRLKSVATCHMPHFQPHWWWNDRVIVPCQSVKRYQRLVNWVPRGRIDVIPNFINPHRLASQESRDAVRNSLGLSSSSFVVGVVGTLEPRKGFLFLLPAIAKAISLGIEVRLVSVGPQQPDYVPQVTRDIDRLRLIDSVQLLGMRNDVPRLLRAFDCICLPSLKEVMPISLLEAMATGLPAVATNVGGVPDCVRHERDGLLVKPQDSEQLFQAICRLATNSELSRAMGQSAKQSMDQSFSSQALIPKIVDTYQKALGRHTRHIAPKTETVQGD